MQTFLYNLHIVAVLFERN